VNEKPDSPETQNEDRPSRQSFSRDLADSAQQVWLAGLGALSRAQTEGSKFFETLATEGARVQKTTQAYTRDQTRHAQKQAGPWAEGARKRTQAAMGKLEGAFDERVKRTMKRMDMPSHADLRELSARIDALSHELHAMRSVARKGAAPSDPPRTTGTRKSTRAAADAREPAAG
jgi:poly(hydroxyalkanoate) granule-associated protein